MNIIDHSTKQECTSCQMCAALCPRNAITIKLNEDGFYRPSISDDLCINCGLCTKVCYKYDSDIKVTTAVDEADKIEVYSAQYISDDLLKRVTSGGVADVLAKELILQGYVCIGVTYNDKMHRAEHVIASTAAETDAFRGSKYIQSYSLDAFKELVKNVKTTKYAVFGLPCHIYAVHQYLTFRKQRENCILIDLFCHGCPTMLVWNKYEQRIKNQLSNRQFDEVQFRSKAKGWGAFHVEVKADGKQAFLSTPKQDEFYTLFFSDHVLNDACNECKLRSTMEYTDIRMGDFWGKRFLGDKKGVSAVAITSKRGKLLFDAVKDQFKITESCMSEVLVKQSYGKTYTPDFNLRKQMLDSLRDKNSTLEETVNIYERKQGMGYKMKKILKYIDWYMPFDLVRFLKRFA